MVLPPLLRNRADGTKERTLHKPVATIPCKHLVATEVHLEVLHPTVNAESYSFSFPALGIRAACVLTKAFRLKATSGNVMELNQDVVTQAGGHRSSPFTARCDDPRVNRQTLGGQIAMVLLRVAFLPHRVVCDWSGLPRKSGRVFRDGCGILSL